MLILRGNVDTLYVCYVTAGIREKLDRGGVFDKLSRDNIFLTTHDAVLQVKHVLLESNLSDKLAGKLVNIYYC